MPSSILIVLLSDLNVVLSVIIIIGSGSDTTELFRHHDLKCHCQHTPQLTYVSITARQPPCIPPSIISATTITAIIEGKWRREYKKYFKKGKERPER